MALTADGLYARGFAADAASLRALREGLEGRKAKLQRGRLAAALRTLAGEPASRVLFVDLDGVSEPAQAARELAAVCAFETAVIAIGSTDSAEFTRTLFKNGIADYLVKPISASHIREACAAVMDDPVERPYAGRVAAFSGSAGSGTSTLVAAIARGLAAEGRTASIVDLDPIAGRLPGLFGVEPSGDLPALLAALNSDAPTDNDTNAVAEQIDDMCAEAEAGVSLVAYAPAAAIPAPPSPDAVLRLLGHLANRTHLVLVTGFPDPVTQLEIMQEADTRVLLYEPTLSSLSAAVRCLALLGAKHPATLVQCLPRASRSALSAAHIRYALGDRKPDVVIPFDPALHTAATEGKSKRPPSRAYRSAVQRVQALVSESAAAAHDG